MAGADITNRVELYRLLSDAGRLRLLALCAEEELSVGELSDLLADSQPQVSKKAGDLRKGGLLTARREGTRTYLSALEDPGDPVLSDALAEGRRLCHDDGSLAKVASVVAAREEAGRRFFEEVEDAATALPHEDPARPAELFALSALLEQRRLAVDLGCGDGHGLDLLSPLFERVFAVDRSRARLARASGRIAARALANVSLFLGSHDDTELVRRTDEAGGADLVFVGRMLHHASRPGEAVAKMARLLAPGGRLIVLDYEPHAEEALREQGDVWLGFPRAELEAWLAAAGLADVRVSPVPASLHRPAEGAGDDLHLRWQLATGRRPTG